MSSIRSYLGRLALLIPGLRHQMLSYEKLCEISGILVDIRGQVTASRLAEALRATEVDWARDPRFLDEKRLLSHQAQVNSQNGEDGMIAEVFRRIGTKSQTFVEIGVEDGLECNSAFLIACGWTGWWIDCDDAMNQTLHTRSASIRQAVKTHVGHVKASNVREIFKSQEIPAEVDLLSIDIDQNTYYVWQALSDYRPRLVVIEYNAVIPASIDWKVSHDPDRVWDQTINMGASLKALEQLGDSMGYCLVGCDFTGTNAFFVRQDLVGDHFAAPYSSENHHEPPRMPLIFRRQHQRNLLDRADP